jgi:ornithine decarboxylase
MKELLFAARQAADALGICFHVGSQAMTPAAYSSDGARPRGDRRGCRHGRHRRCRRRLPLHLSGMEPPPLEHYFEVIHRAFESLPISYSAELWCEPAARFAPNMRASSSASRSAAGDELYINDGAYGALFDAAHIGWRFSGEARPRGSFDTKDMAFSFYGPTCDDLDHMPGRFICPRRLRPATISKSVCWRLWLREATLSTASASISSGGRRRADGQPSRAGGA